MRLTESRNVQQPSSVHPSGRFLALEETTAQTRTDVRLFYGKLATIMAARFEVEGNSFRSERARIWSTGRYQARGTNRVFDLHPDGRRLALARATRSVEKQDKVELIFNFVEELRRLTAAH